MTRNGGHKGKDEENSTHAIIITPHPRHSQNHFMSFSNNRLKRKKSSIKYINADVEFFVMTQLPKADQVRIAEITND